MFDVFPMFKKKVDVDVDVEVDVDARGSMSASNTIDVTAWLPPRRAN